MNFWDVVTAIAPAVTGILGRFGKPIKAKEEYKVKKSLLGRITYVGWIIIVVSLATPFVVAYSKQAEKLENLRATRPQIEVYQPPYFFARFDSAFRITMNAHNFGDRTASNIVTSVCPLTNRNGLLEVMPPLVRKGNMYNTIAKNSGMSFDIDMTIGKDSLLDQYLFWKTTYTDENGEFSDTMRKIYIIPTKHARLNLPFHELNDSSAYYSIVNILKSLNVW